MAIKILLAEAEKNAELLKETIKDSDTYRALLKNIECCLSIARDEMLLRADLEAFRQAGTDTMTQETEAKAEIIPLRKDSEKCAEPEEIPTEKCAEPVEEPAEESVEETAKEVEPEPETPAKVYSYEETRGMLGKARTERGVDINSLIKGMGCEYFSAVPAERYEELLKAAGCI